MRRWRGLKSLVVDAVDHGSRAVEKIQMETARLPFDILEKIPPLTVPVKGIRLIHDTSVAATHGMIRLVTRAVGGTINVVLDVVEQRAMPTEVSGGGDAHEAGSAPPASAP